MTSAHIFFIPLVLLVGLVLGIALGRRSILVQQAEEERQRRLAEKKAKAQAAQTQLSNAPSSAPQARPDT